MKFKTDYKYLSRKDKGRYVCLKYKKILKGKILDIGCSKERSLEKELPKEVKYIGLDIVPEADIQIDLEKTERLPFGDNFFDVVVCTDVLEHLDNLHNVLTEIIRMSKSYIILSLPNPWSGIWRSIVNNTIYQGGLDNKEKRWLKFYGLPDEKAVDRHKWFFSFSEAEKFFANIAHKFNLEILQIDGEMNNVNGFKDGLKKIILDSFGIEVDLSSTNFNKKRGRLIKDLYSGTIWAVLKKCN